MPAYSVVDAGVAFVAVAQSSAVGDSCRRLLVDLQQEGRRIVAPALWLYETTSIVTKAIRFGQLTVETGIQALELLGELELQLVEPDPDQRRRAFDWTLQLERAAAYDSFYLALAEQLDADLWTTDLNLVRAVGKPWVKSASEV